MARGERAGVESAAPSRGRRRELRRLAPPRAPGASGFAAALRPVPLREACAFVPFEAFAAARAGAAEVCGSGEARARRRREGRARRQRVRSRVTTRRAEARRGGPRLGGARERSRVRVDRKKRRARREGVRREDPEPHGSRRTVPRAGTAPSPGMALVSRVSPVRCLVSPPGEKPRAPLFARAAREMGTRARDLVLSLVQEGQPADLESFRGGGATTATNRAHLASMRGPLFADCVSVGCAHYHIRMTE